jgi:hypothetical protein
MPRGRPPKIDLAMARRVAEFVEAGNFLETAVRLAQVPHSTFWRYMAKGEEDVKYGRDTPYREFHDIIQLARARLEHKLVSVVTEGTDGAFKNPLLALRMLEKAFPDRWGQKVEHTGRGGGPIQVDDAREELAAKLDEIAKRLAPEPAPAADEEEEAPPSTA